MQQIHPETWQLMYLWLMFLITGAQILALYALSRASNPSRGLGLYMVYFMAALLGWIAFALQLGAQLNLTLDVPSVASILSSYILFLAASERAEVQRGRYFLGFVCIAACFSVFFLESRSILGLQAVTATLFFGASGLICARRSWQKANAGDAVIAAAALMMLTGIPVALYQWLSQANYPLAQTIVFGVYSSAYVLVAIGFLLSIAVEYQHKLSHLTLEDPLTQLLNRRGLENALRITLAQADRQQAVTSAALVDIDHLSEVNDNFGHDYGDQVIRHVAQTLQRMSRSGDVVARTSGEEFLLILPNTPLDGARILAERIRVDISDEPVMINQQRIPITVSLGVAGITGEVALDELSQKADQAMYLAKRGGRNRVASVENTTIHLRAAEDKG